MCKPTHNGEALTSDRLGQLRWRVMPWEALFEFVSANANGPVTTEPFGVRPQSCHAVGNTPLV